MTDYEIDLIYDYIDELLLKNKYDKVDEILKDCPLDVSADLVLLVLTSTLPAKGNLKYREEFFDRFKDRIGKLAKGLK
jgi:hypothetical protein